MPRRVSRSRMVGRGRGHTLESYVIRAPPAGVSGMINAALIYGSMSSIQFIYPLTADAYTLGSTTKEWLALYIGDAGGIYFGLGQDILLSRGAANRLDLATGDSFNIVSGELRFGNTAVIDASRILVGLASVGQNLVPDGASTRNLGSTTAEWLNFYLGTGKIYLGAGQEANLYASGANLKTDDQFEVVGGIITGADIVSDAADTDSLGSTTKEWLNIYIGDAGKLYFGLGQDVNLYRESANELRTDDALNVGDTAYNIRIRADGSVIYFGDRSGSWDTNLFRAAAHTLKTADDFQIGTGKGLYTDLIGEFTGGAGVTIDTVLLKDSDVICDEIYLDIANQDCVLRRGGANLIQTPDSIEADIFQSIKGAATGTAFRAIVSGEGNDRLRILITGEMRWSAGLTAQDTNLYRATANVLKTDDTFVVGLGVRHINIITKTNADTPYTVTASDRVILCDTSGGVIELDLPAVAGVTGMILTIKKTTADATVVTLDGDGAEEIDGAVNNTEIDAQWDTLTIYCDGTQWLIISHKIA